LIKALPGSAAMAGRQGVARHCEGLAWMQVLERREKGRGAVGITEHVHEEMAFINI